MKIYQWLNLQKGQLPLQVDGCVLPLVEHVCSVTLIWPEDEKLSLSNSLIIDPCFSLSGYRFAKNKMLQINASLFDIGFYFITHKHYDHRLRFPNNEVVPD